MTVTTVDPMYGHTVDLVLFDLGGVINISLAKSSHASFFHLVSLTRMLSCPTNLQLMRAAAAMEAYHGLYIIFELVLPTRNLMQIYIWWQYLRMRYMLDQTGAARLALSCMQPVGTILSSSRCREVHYGPWMLSFSPYHFGVVSTVCLIYRCRQPEGGVPGPRPARADPPRYAVSNIWMIILWQQLCAIAQRAVGAALVFSALLRALTLAHVGPICAVL